MKGTRNEQSSEHRDRPRGRRSRRGAKLHQLHIPSGGEPRGEETGAIQHVASIASAKIDEAIAMLDERRNGDAGVGK